MNGQQAEGHPELMEADSKNLGDGTNLIVNYIPTHLTENDLRNLFSPYGNIMHCKIVFDRHTRQSLGYGFVKYDVPESSQTAIAALNSHQIANKRLKVSVAKPPDRDSKSNLYISGLPAHFTQHDLKELVAPFGKVLEARVLLDTATRKCRGVGFARMDCQKSALTAIASLTGNQLEGGPFPLVVKFADNNSDKQRKVQQHPTAQAYSPVYASVGMAVPAALANTPQQRYSPQQNQPTFNTNTVANNGASAGPRSNGFDQYAANVAGYYTTANANGLAGMNVNAATAAALVPNQYTHQTSAHASPNNAYPNPAVSSPSPMFGQQPQNPLFQRGNDPNMKEQFTGICLFIYHLPPEVNEAALFSLFSNYGLVTSAKVMRDLQTGRNKGFGFVNMANQGQAEAALASLNGFQMGNKFLKVSFKTEKTKSAQ